MKTCHLHIATSNTNRGNILRAFLQRFSHPFSVGLTTAFSQKETAGADLLFVDEEIARKHCRDIADLKSKTGLFPVILLVSKKFHPEKETLPDCIDDVMLPTFIPSVWERRLLHYAELIKRKKNIPEQEENYRKIIENAPDIIVLIDRSGIIKYVNRRIYEYGKYQPEEIIGQPVTAFIPPEDHDLVKEAVQRVFENNRDTRFFATSLLLKNGQSIPILTKGILLKFGDTFLNMTVIRDISSIKEAENRIKESKETFENIFNNQSVAIYIQDKKGTFLDINRAALLQYGYKDKSSLIGKTPEFVAAEGKNHMALVKKHLQAAFEGKPQRFEFWARRSDGSVFPKLVLLEKGTWFGKKVLYNFSFDITERKKMEEALRDSEEKFNAIFNSSPSPAHLVNRNFEIVLANKKLLQLTGKTLNDIRGKKCYAIFQQKNEVCEDCTVKLVFEKGKPASTEGRLMTPRGETRYYNTLAYPITDNQGNIRYAVESTLDITEVVKTNEKLKQSEAKYYNLFHYMQNCVAVYGVSETGDIVIKDFNRAAEKLEQVKKEEVVGKRLEEVFPGVKDFGIYQAILRVARTGKPENPPVKFYKDNRIAGWRENYLYKLPSGEVVVIYNDVTQQKKAEEQLKESMENYRLLFEKAPFGIFIVHPDGTILDANPVLLKIVGSPSLEATKKINVMDFPLLVEAGYVNHFKACLSTGKIVRFKTDYTSKWGKSFVAETTFVPLKDEKGDIRKVYTLLRDITEQERAEQLLKESENKYRSLAETSSDLILTFDTNGKFTYLSPALKAITGYTPKEILHKYFWDFIAPEYVDSTIEKFKRGILGEHIPLYEIELLHKNGHRIPVELNVTTLFDAKGKPIGRLAVARDISERRKAEKALKESELRLKRFSKITTEGIIFHKNGIIFDANHAILRMLGYSLQDLIGQNIVKKLALPKYYRLIREHLRKDFTDPYDIEVYKKDGSLLPVEVAGVNYRDNHGETFRASVFRDISRRLKMEKALRESENKYRSLAETSVDMILTYDLEGRITYVNPAVKNIFGYDPVEIMGKKFTDFVLTQDVEKAVENFTKGKSGRPVPLYELEILHKNGKNIPVEINPTSLYDAEGNIVGRLTIVRDITARKKTEESLRLLAKALNAAANAVVITDATGKIEWINRAFTTLTGYSKTEAVGKHSKELIESNKQDPTFFQELNKIVLSGKVWKGEIIDKRKDGTLYVVEEMITPVTNARGEVEHLIGIMTDITERKQAERELLAAKEAAEEASRLKTAFLANMNHEIRTPMNAIMGFSSLLLDTANPKEKEHYARIINNSADQLLKLIDDVIYLSRLQSEKLPVKKIVFHPLDIVKEIHEMFSLPHMKKALDVKMSVPENAGQILMKADDYKIKQVLTNFVSNAVKYTEKGYVEIGFETKDKDILFFVKDTGMGIPEEEQKHIFEAFFRGNRAVNSAIRGTGLGLNIAKELVELMGGRIGVRSQPGKGSYFYFILPCELIESTAPRQEERKNSANKQENMSVLIVEDDETNYLYFHVVLKDKVRKTDHARNGREAVEKIHHHHYDLVLMDIKMPVMDGYNATQEIKKYRPELPVIATTAYATQEEKEKALEAGCDEYLSKPVKKEELFALLEKYGPEVNNK